MKKRILAMLVCLTIGGGYLAAQSISARWQLESDQAVVGQGLRLTIQVQGTDSIQIPQFSIDGVEIDWQGGQPSSSSSVIIRNGVRQSTVTRSFVGSWSLKSQKSGRYRFAGLRINVAGQTIELAPFEWVVKEAQQDERYQLKQSLNQTIGILGVDLEYSLVWYLAESARAPDFSIALLENKDLEFIADLNQAYAGRDVFQLQYRSLQLIGIKSSEQINGRDFTKVSFKIKFRPRKSARYELSPTMVSFEGVAGTHKVRDFFNRTIEEPYYRTLAAKANALVLEVKDLPQQGKPAAFSGLIGKLKLTWKGAAGPYRLGEPIRLNLALDGVANLPDLDLDYMVTQTLSKNDFSIVSDPTANAALADPANNKVQASPIVRAFILRARKPGLLIVPQLTLSYFDPQSNSYGLASSQKLELGIEGELVGDNVVTAGATSLDQGSAQVSTRAALLNPPGLPAYSSWSLPWYLWSLPGFVAALVLVSLGLWRHSAHRQLLVQRKHWRSNLRQLNVQTGRLALEEGRRRLEALCQPGALWRTQLESHGVLADVTRHWRSWDEAYFDQGRDNEDWNKRWQEILQALGALK